MRDGQESDRTLKVPTVSQSDPADRAHIQWFGRGTPATDHASTRAITEPLPRYSRERLLVCGCAKFFLSSPLESSSAVSIV